MLLSFFGIDFFPKWLCLLVFCGFFAYSNAYSQNDSLINAKTLPVKTEFDYKGVLRKLFGFNNFNPQSQLSGDSLPSIGKRLWQNIKDDIKNTNGRVDVGYSYGLNTIFTDTTRGISSIFNTSGSMQTGVLGLPVLVSYNYSTLKVPLGANNYFRISFDKQRYLDKQKAKVEEQLSKVGDMENKLEQKKSVLSSIQGYTEVYMDMLKRKMEREANRMAKEAQQRAKDSLALRSDSIKTNDSGYSDTLSTTADSLQRKRDAAQSQMEHYKNEYDSIMVIYQKIMSAQRKCDSLTSAYGTYKDKLSEYSSDLKKPDIMSLGTGALGKMDFIKSIRKIDIGLTYPKTTGLSTQSTAIKGIGTEFQYKQYYLAVSAGLTLNNVMMSTNEITNQLNYNQNVFNQFDYQQVLDNGLLTTIKTGWGTPEQTHVFVGFNYLTNTRFLSANNTTGPTYDPAASMELDIRYVPSFYKGGALDLVYGKTSSNRQLDTTNQSGVFESLFSKYRSNTFLAKYTQQVSILRSDFSLQFRSIDPYANTTVYGMMQPGNRRIEFDSRHRIAAYLKFGTTYKMEETYGYLDAFRLHTVGVNASGSVTEYFSYSALLNHVSFTSERATGQIHRGTTYLGGITLQSNYVLKKLKTITSVNYNDYLFSDTSGAVKYTQFGLIHTMGERKWSTSIKYDYFFRSAASIQTGTHVTGVSVKYTMKKVKIDGGISVATEMNASTSMGGHLDVRWQVLSFMDLTFHAERFVMGNFYRNYYRSLYERFPYLFSINVGFKF